MTDIALDRRKRPDRRVGRVSFHYPERRTGFARRGRTAYDLWLERYRSRPGAIAAVLAAFVALNVADLTFTLYALERGATEVNPVMDALLGVSPALAAGVKLTVAVLAAAGLWLLRRFRLVLQTSLGLLVAFTALLAYHLIGAVLVG